MRSLKYLSLSVASIVALADDASVLTALDQDDDCQTSSCAVSAVQRRAAGPAGDCRFAFADCFAITPMFRAAPILEASDFKSLLLPAPAENGTEADLATLHYQQLSRSVNDVIAEWAYLSDQNIFAYSPAVGADLERSAPTFSKCIATFYDSIRAVNDAFKDQVARPRPFETHPNMKPCLPEESSYSYPSGHATFYAATDLLLSVWFPQMRDRINHVSNNGAFARARCGVHYPSDVVAGQKLGERAAYRLMDSPQWKLFVDHPSKIVMEELAAVNRTRPAAGLPIFPRQVMFDGAIAIR
mmetsp:Transcript_62252/g.145987  ORF Transcript_62252/g.145987 Transcript_62252/m.145987 type:complete len:299 (-) Transcript_62252:81-977(-)